MLPWGVVADDCLKIAGQSVNNCLDMVLQSLNHNVCQREIVLLGLSQLVPGQNDKIRFIAHGSYIRWNELNRIALKIIFFRVLNG